MPWDFFRCSDESAIALDLCIRTVFFLLLFVSCK